MRADAAKVLPFDRERGRRAALDLSPVAIRRPTCARAGLQVGGVSAAFLIVYSVLQLLHEAGRDPAAVSAINGIPLFARFAAGALLALPLGLLLPLFVRDRERALAWLPRLLAAAVALFVLTVMFFA